MEFARGQNLRKRTFSDMNISYKNIGIYTNSLPKTKLSRKILFKGKISRKSISKDSLANDNSSKNSMSKDDLAKDNSPKKGFIGKKRPAPLDISFQSMNSSMPSSTQKRTRILDEEIKNQSSSDENDRDSPVIVDITLKPSYTSKISRITEIIDKMKELNMNRTEDGLSFNKKRNEHDDKNILLHTMEMEEEDCEEEEDVIIENPYLNASLSEDDTDSIVGTDYSEEEKESISETESSSDGECYSLYDSF
ncbi:BA71V-DP238L (l1L) [African swine fever virus]|nr:BA71V-DP238L (l1L) [African swine fever virus]